jgi:hypothetical protein
MDPSGSATLLPTLSHSSLGSCEEKPAMWVEGWRQLILSLYRQLHGTYVYVQYLYTLGQ